MERRRFNNVSPSESQFSLTALRSKLIVAFVAILAGIITGVTIIISEISLASLIYAGPLSQFLAQGIGFCLIGVVVLTLIVGVTSVVRGSVVVPQDNAAAIMALIAASIAGQLPPGTNATTIFATVVAALALCTVLTSLLFLFIGKFRLADLVRYSPYPVIGGFLAGTGWLLIRGALSMMTGLAVTIESLTHYLEPQMLTRWGPGVVFGLLLFILHKRLRHPLVVPAMLVIGIIVFHLMMQIFGISPASATAHGWLLNVTTQSALWTPPFPAVLSEVHWDLVIAQIPNALAVSLICGISLLLNMTGLEMRGTKTIDLNHELFRTGLANLLAASGGSTPGYMSLSRTLIGLQISPPSRIISLTVAALCAVTIAFGGAVLNYFPVFVLGGLLISSGLSLLLEWLYRTWFRLNKIDYTIIVGILLTISLFGVPAGVTMGVVIECILFIVSYSRIGVVKGAFTLSTLRSRVARPLLDSRLLEQKGTWVHILVLQGHLFFGTANQLFNSIRTHVQDGNPRYILLDFQRVAGMDFSAVVIFTKIKRLLNASNIEMVFTNVSPAMDTLLRHEVFSANQAEYHSFPDLDRGLEWCEDNVLQSIADVGLISGIHSNIKQMEKRFPKIEKLFGVLVDETAAANGSLALKQENVIATLKDYLIRREVDAGVILTDEKAAHQTIHFIEAGKVEVRRTVPDGRQIRLRVLGAGTCIGEIGFYSDRPASATVITLEPSLVYDLGAETLQRIEVENPAVAIAFHRYMAHVLSERMILSTDDLALAMQ